VDGVKYKPAQINKEEELERFAKEHYKDIFGEDCLYFDLRHKLTSKAGIASIPDGYVIKISDPPKWYVVEIELSSHPLFDHIVPQLSKFIHGITTQGTRRELVDAFYEEITSNIITQSIVRKHIGSGEIYRFLSRLVSNSPTLAIVIDEKTGVLEEACSSLPLIQKHIIEFRIFERVDAGIRNAYLFEPLYETKAKEEAPREERIPPSEKLLITGDRAEIVLGKMHTPRRYNLIPLYRRMTARRFFPGYKIPFILETDIGDVEVKVTSGKKGDQVGDPIAGKYIQGKGLRTWYNKHQELETGDTLVIERTDKEKRYRLSTKKGS